MIEKPQDFVSLDIRGLEAKMVLELPLCGSSKLEEKDLGEGAAYLD